MLDNKHNKQIEDFVIKSCFKFDINSNYYRCILPNDEDTPCTGIQKGRFHLNNARKHLMSRHEDQFLEILRKKCEKASNDSIEKKLNILEKTEMTTFITLSTTLANFNDSLSQMLTAGLSFKICENQGFKNLLEPYAKQFNITLNRNYLIKVLEDSVKSLKYYIISKISNTYFSLKLDGSTQFRKQYIAVNLQFVENNTVSIYNLSTIQLTNKATGEYLASIIKQVINDFNLSSSYCMSVTVDNGRNMLSCIKNLNDLLSSEFESDDENNEIGNDNLDENNDGTITT